MTTVEKDDTCHRWEKAASRFLQQSKGVAAALLDQQNTIVRCNQPFASLAGIRNLGSGVPLLQLLSPGQEELLSALWRGADQPLRLNFSPAGQGTQSLLAEVHPMEGALLLVGEKVMLTQSELVDRMGQMQSELLTLTRQLQKEKAALERANRKIKTLQGLLPICASCKKVRDDQGYWNKVESYIQERTDVRFSHGICPECMERLYGDLESGDDE